MDIEIRRSIISGKRKAPSSCAIAHRAIIAASFADGQTVISGVPSSSSLDATISICNSLGADILVEGDVADVLGRGEIYPKKVINCRQSNSALKLFMGIFSHLPNEVRFDGTDKLLSINLRPFTYFIDYYSGYTFNPSAALPLYLRGPINSQEMVYPVQLGTQFLSGILLGAPFNDQATGIGISGTFKDPHALNETINIMKKAGIDFLAEYSDLIMLQGGQGFLPLKEYEIPKSKRAASYLLLAGALAGKCTVEGIGKYQQLEALFSRFGATLSSTESSITASTSFLEAADVDVSILDYLACHALVLACLAKGQSRLLGFKKISSSLHLRLKRLKFELSKMGASILETPDGFIVQGGKLHGAIVDSRKDPHIAMACAAAALCAEGPTTICNAEYAELLFPNFFQQLALIGAIVR
ncbi:MAG: hypothetical protein N3G80_00290 [Candidatus Micrarchaeota archaeon]|nr:hypothetical protein [Candidatus Micrarchaeota archaeon]